MKKRRSRPLTSPMSLSAWRHASASFAVAGLALAWVPSARAQVSAADRVAAESLFSDARQLMQCGLTRAKVIDRDPDAERLE